MRVEKTIINRANNAYGIVITRVIARYYQPGGARPVSIDLSELELNSWLKSEATEPGCKFQIYRRIRKIIPRIGNLLRHGPPSAVGLDPILTHPSCHLTDPVWHKVNTMDAARISRLFDFRTAPIIGHTAFRAVVMGMAWQRFPCY